MGCGEKKGTEPLFRRAPSLGYGGKEAPSPFSPRIAQVVEAFEGGCKRHVLDLLGGLSRERFQQTAIVGAGREPTACEEVAAATGGAAEFVSWDVRRTIRPGSDWAAYRFLSRLFRERSFDLIHCHSAKAGFLGRMAARGTRAAVLYTPHCLPFMMDAPRPVRAGYLWLERHAGRFTDRLIAVSPSEAEGAAAARLVAPDRLVTIENGIDPESVRTEVDPRRKRAELGLPERSRVVLSVGALRRQKGHGTLIEAAAAAANLLPDAVFLIAGEGELRPELESLSRRLGVADRVRLLGRREDVTELFAVADVLAMPSLWEAGPYALLEAMAAGVPVIGSRIPGIADWVAEGRTGYLFEPGDSPGLARALVAALSDPAEAHRRAQAAQEMVLQRNTRERWLREMTALYDSVAPRP